MMTDLNTPPLGYLHDRIQWHRDLLTRIGDWLGTSDLPGHEFMRVRWNEWMDRRMVLEEDEITHLEPGRLDAGILTFEEDTNLQITAHQPDREPDVIWGTSRVPDDPPLVRSITYSRPLEHFIGVSDDTTIKKVILEWKDRMFEVNLTWTSRILDQSRPSPLSCLSWASGSHVEESPLMTRVTGSYQQPEDKDYLSWKAIDETNIKRRVDLIEGWHQTTDGKLPIKGSYEKRTPGLLNETGAKPHPIVTQPPVRWEISAWDDLPTLDELEINLNALKEWNDLWDWYHDDRLETKRSEADKERALWWAMLGT